MARAFFISDAHLGLDPREQETEKENRLLSFLRHVERNGTHLFIVGDLFDAWFEYRTVIPKGYHRLLTALEDLTRKGIHVHYLAGNHDYWMGNYFHEYLGINIAFEPFAVTIDGKKFYIHHGDGLAGKDVGYRILKSVLRNPLAIWLYSWLHPDIGINLAKFSSKTSRGYTANKDYGEEDSLYKFAAGKMAEGFDYVVMGHRHKPVVARIKTGTYVNLGDWISSFTYGDFSGGELVLKSWNDTAADSV